MRECAPVRNGIIACALPERARFATIADAGRRMKSLNNTLLAAIIAIVLTAIVGVLPWEGPTSDEMMKWCYKLHQKYAPRPPDPHLVVATIDENSVQLLGRWPFPRSVHAGFLGVLSNEKPKTVVFDIFFTEESGSNVAPDAQPPANSPPAPDASGSAPAPAPSAPSAPDSPAPPPPSGNSLLSSSRTCKNQAFRFKTRLFGFQYHIELTEADIEALLANDRAGVAALGEDGAVKVREGTGKFYRRYARLGDHLLKNFVQFLKAY